MRFIGQIPSVRINKRYTVWCSLFILLLFSINACKNSVKKQFVRLEPPSPALVQATLEKQLSAPESFFTMPITLDLKLVERMINEQLGEELYTLTNDELRSSFPKINADNIHVTRQGPISVSTSDNLVNISMNIRIAGGVKAALSGLASPRKELDIEAKIGASMYFYIDDTWNLRSVTTPKSEVTKGLSFDVFGYEISLNNLTQKVFDKVLPTMMPGIDQAISDHIDLESTVHNFWNELKKTVLVTPSPKPVWVQFQSSEMMYSPPVSYGTNALKMSIALKTKIVTSIGHKPQLSIERYPPAPIKQVLNNDDGFSLNMPVVVLLDSIKPLVQDQLKGLSFVVPGSNKQVVVNDIELMGNGKQLLAKIGLGGQYVQGNIYVVGTPVYHKNTKTIRFEDFDYTLETSNLLKKQASWLINKLFLDMIQERLSYDLTNDLINAQKSISEAINGYQFNMGQLNSHIETLEPTNLQFDNNVLRLDLQVKGKLDLHIK